MQLYRVSVKVRPSTNHPLFWDAQYGYLQVWIFGDSPEDAGMRVRAIVEQLPYELPDSRVAIHPIEKPEENPMFETHEQTAREIGLSLFLPFVQTGGEGETDFDRDDPI